MASLWGLLGGCREQSTVPIDRNQAPETFLTRAPGDSQTTFYRVRLHWHGSDFDGVVVAYDVAVTESLPADQNAIQWRRTRRSDSLVTFPVEETREVLGHRFYARAIDNEGKSDETPAWIFFGARNNVPPTVRFLRAIAYGPGQETKELDSTNPDFPTDTIPTGWGVTFAWTGSDGDVAVAPDGTVIQVGRVDRFFHRLLPIESEWPPGSLADTAAQYGPEYFARFPRGSVYAMQIRAIDDGGLSGSGTATRSFVWNQDPVSRLDRCPDPDQGGRMRRCFTVEGETFHEGDTLALRPPPALPPDIVFRATAFDPDPLDGNPAVLAKEWRYGTGAVFSSWAAFPDNGDQVILSSLYTGDYMAMVRSVDALDRVEGSPDTLRFYINLVPRFVTQIGERTQTPMPGDRFRLSEVADGIPLLFWAENPDGYPSEQMRYGYRFEGPDTREFFFRDSQTLYPNAPYEVAAARPSSGFRVGRWKVQIQVEDNRQSGGELRGSRSTIREVPIDIVRD